MTTQTSFSEKAKSRTTTYLIGELKRSWTKAMLYFVVLLLAMPVAILISVTGSNISVTNENAATELLTIIDNYSSIWYAIIMVIALYAGCSALSYLTKRVSSDFLHSTPLRRDDIYYVKLGVGTADFLAAFLLNAIIMLFVCFSTNFVSGEYISKILIAVLKILGIGCLSFATVFSITVFSGMICGTTSMQLILSAFFNFFPLLYYYCLYAIISKYTTFINTDYYCGEGFLIRLAPPVRFCSSSAYNLSLFDIITFVFIDVLLIVFALQLYKIRKTERAGTPIVFEVFSKLFKYLIITPCTVLVGLFFNLLAGGVWMIIGFVIGAVLSLMLMNSVLFKNARKMFSGIKAFSVYCVCYAAIFTCIAFDIFGIDGYVPNTESITDVKISAGQELCEVDFKDKEIISEAERLIKDYIADSKSKESTGFDYYYVPNVTVAEDMSIDSAISNSYDDIFFNDTGEKIYITVTFVMDNGIHVSLGSFGISVEKLANLFRLIVDSVEYKAFMKDTEEFSKGYCFMPNRFNEYSDKYNGTYALSTDILNDELKIISAEKYNDTCIGYYFWNGRNFQNKNMFIPVFAGSENASEFLGGRSYEDMLDIYSKSIDYILIAPKNSEYNEFTIDSEGTLLITDKEKIKEILRSVTSISDNKSIFTASDEKYSIGVSISLLGDDGTVRYHNTFTTDFIAGRTPDFITNAYKDY